MQYQQKLKALEILFDGEDLHLFSQIVPKHYLWRARTKHFQQKLIDSKNNATIKCYKVVLGCDLEIEFKSNPMINFVKRIREDGIEVCGYEGDYLKNTVSRAMEEMVQCSKQIFINRLLIFI